ncbi:SIR2 family protein [Sphingobacterium sp. PCS056]|uniref:SIR2 family protein n=1 Tax=Sphingobacterium sp. PCS056 TaxID=2931400 RepID=UPI00200EA555|nr:SIR2 family protein [Sphingobacterium sp. PCS056]UPZ38599.1 SIR2 family protein [Sphingobacterium sp. PCS056]
MTNTALLIGNDINNINKGTSWNDLLISIKNKYHVQTLENGRKPFPMLYEEIFLSAIQQQHMDEKELKTFIADAVSNIQQNELHELIRELSVENIMTTNYDFSLAGTHPKEKTSLVNETTYSVFRKYHSLNKTYWHIHGDCNNPFSINLGYEHYCGQLQKMRDYVVNGPNYSASTKIYKASLIRRLQAGRQMVLQSWIDLFFTTDIHIFGLSLDFVEIDLWWLLTYRARNKFYKKNTFIKNQIYYYIPNKYVNDSSDKIQLLRANDVKVEIIDEENKSKYYQKIINSIKLKL